VILAQLQIRGQGGEPSCVERNGFCPGWIADNWERYKTR
jgi:osmoprotectant transport system permease protein